MAKKLKIGGLLLAAGAAAAGLLIWKHGHAQGTSAASSEASPEVTTKSSNFLDSTFGDGTNDQVKNTSFKSSKKSKAPHAKSPKTAKVKKAKKPSIFSKIFKKKKKKVSGIGYAHGGY